MVSANEAFLAEVRGAMTGRQQFARLLPLALLLLLAMLGLRGETAAPAWDGPLKAHGVLIGLILEAVFAVLIAVTRVRETAARRAARSATSEDAADHPDVPGALRWVLTRVLGAGMLAVAAMLLLNLNLHVFTGARPRQPPALRLHPPTKLPTPGNTVPVRVHVPLDEILYALLIAALVVAAAASVWWAARLRRPAAPGPAQELAEDSADLRDAVEEGRAALAELDDARAAIIACYSAMERSLAERGTARTMADTPDELLNRAVTSGIVRGPAPRRLTALFYEARFSSHPLGTEQRDAARQALEDLAAELSARPDSAVRSGTAP